MMGVIPGIYKLTMHRDRPGNIFPERSIVDLCSVIKPDFCIIDGTTGMEGSGPCEGRKVNSNVIIVGDDPVATDAI